MTKEVNLKELRLHRTEATPLTRLHVYTIDGSHWRDGDQWDTSAQASFPAAELVTSGQDDDVDEEAATRAPDISRSIFH